MRLILHAAFLIARTIRQQSVFCLARMSGGAVINPQKQEKKKEQKSFALPPANPDMHRIYAYLMKQREIELDVIHAFTIPKIESAEMMFSAARSRRLQIVSIIQSFAQLEKNYGKEGADIIVDNTQLIMFGGFAPNSSSADTLSRAMGNRTVQVGTVSKSKNNPSQSLQMASRPLMSADELKALPKGTFIVMKTGQHPMKTKLKLFFEWGIAFGKPYQAEEHGNRAVDYAAKDELLQAIQARYPKPKNPNSDSEIPEGAIPVGAEDLVLSSKPPKRGRSIRLHPRPQPHQHRPPEQEV